MISCIATLLQLLLIVLGVSVEWFKFLLIPSLVGIGILCIAAGFLIYRTPQADNSTTINEIQEIDSRMFSIKEAVIIAVSLTLIQTGIYGANLLLGDSGLILGTFLASLFEVHAAVAGVVVQGNPHNLTLIYAVMIGLAAHAVSKSINSFVTGGWRFFLYFAPSQILHMLGLIFILLSLK